MAAKQARQNYGFFKVWHKNGRVLIQVNPQDRAIVINNNKDLLDLINSITTNSIQCGQPYTQQLPQPQQYQPIHQQFQHQQCQHQFRQNQPNQQIFRLPHQQPSHQPLSQNVQSNFHHQYFPQHSTTQQQFNKRARNINNNNRNNYNNNFSKNFTNNSLQANRDPRNSHSPRPLLYRNPTQSQPRIPSILDPRFSVPSPQTQNNQYYSSVPTAHTVAHFTSLYPSSAVPSTSLQNASQFPPSVHDPQTILGSQPLTHPKNLSPLSNSMNSQLEQLGSSIINFSQAQSPDI